MTTTSQKMNKDMNTTNHITRFIRSSSFAFAAVLITGLVVTATSANAQYKPTSDHGITASPRLSEQLNERKGRIPTTSAALPAMACSKCKDTLVSGRNTEPKGAGAGTLMGQTTKLVAQHLCGACRMDWTIVGTGKAKQSVATHKCSAGGSENPACCSRKGSGAVATKG
jgi:hypothetical protein